MGVSIKPYAYKIIFSLLGNSHQYRFKPGPFLKLTGDLMPVYFYFTINIQKVRNKNLSEYISSMAINRASLEHIRRIPGKTRSGRNLMTVT